MFGVDHYRKAHRAAGREDEEQPRDPGGVPQTTQGSLDFKVPLAGLPESQREVIARTKVNGMSLEEVTPLFDCRERQAEKADRAY